jgi:hypothetical protein
MPSIAVQAAKVAFSAADSSGRITVDSTGYLYPGTYAWMRLTDNSLKARVRILAVLGTTTILVRRCNSKQEPDGTVHDQENYGPPRYTISDMSAFNAGGYIAVEPQTAPVDPAFSKRVIP